MAYYISRVVHQSYYFPFQEDSRKSGILCAQSPKWTQPYCPHYLFIFGEEKAVSVSLSFIFNAINFLGTLTLWPDEIESFFITSNHT